MATTNKDFIYELSLEKVIETFFRKNTPAGVQEFFFKIFQCWGINECRLRAEISDKEVALFFDQLNDLVAAAYILHQANRVLDNEQKGNNSE